LKPPSDRIVRRSSNKTFPSIVSSFGVVPLVFAMLVSFSPVNAAAITLPALMPLPSSVSGGEASFTFNESFTVAYSHVHDDRLSAAVGRMLARLEYVSGVPLARAAEVSSGTASLTIDVTGSDAPIQSLDEDESYTLIASPQGIQLTSPSVVGAMHGMETLLQLFEFREGQAVIPAVQVKDSPRFRWRGLMIDTGRHFEPVEVIKRNLDGMALVKLNVFHWHLSDDQGFRAQSKLYPKLTGLGSHGEFYTQEQMREVVAYARARGIRVVPEFDMPGHTLSWQVAYPELGSSPGPLQLPDRFGIHDEALDPSRQSTYAFLDRFVGEMAAIFPDAYFHIGGDESNGKAWLANPKIVAFMKQKSIPTTAGLQVYFNRQLLEILQKHGKHMVGWDEVLTPGLPTDVVIQSWRGEASLANGAAQGYQGILSHPYYLDAEAPAEQHFLADPIPADSQLTAEEQRRILGGEICMWGEQLNARTIDSRVWPRSAAIAERFWSPASDRDAASMYTRLETISLQLETAGLTHISGPQKMLRNLASARNPLALATLASVLEPVSFHERYQSQHTDARTPLDRLVDAVVPDPASRFEIATQVAEVTSAVATGGDPALARQMLRERFQSWVDASRVLPNILNASPRMSDAAVRGRQLGQLGQAGLEALDHLHGASAPDAWKAEQLQLIADAAKPVALVRFTFLPSLQKLVEAAVATGP
jgi:hexosaminidase